MKFYRRTSEKPVRTRYFQATTTPTSARTPLQPLRTREALTPPTRTTTRTTTPPPLASLICTKWGRSGTPANPFQLHFAATLATPVQNNFPFTCCNAAKIHNCAHTHTPTHSLESLESCSGAEFVLVALFLEPAVACGESWRVCITISRFQGPVA